VAPPLMAPDEPAHLMRACQISHGQMIGHLVPDGSGGSIDSGLSDLASIFVPFVPAGAPPIDVGRFLLAREIPWKAKPVRFRPHGTAFSRPLSRRYTAPK